MELVYIYAVMSLLALVGIIWLQIKCVKTSGGYFDRNRVEPRCAVIDVVACKARTVAWLQGKTCGDDEQFDLLASLW